MIYLDYAATTPVDQRVADKMYEVLKNQYSNSASVINSFSLEINHLIDQARTDVARLINANNKNIIFTSGASEANNFILKGLFERYGSEKNHIITSKVEHKSILEVCKFLEKRGVRVTYIDVDVDGKLNLQQIEEAITEETLVVSIMMVNNEIGTINEIQEIGKLCREKGVFFHTDLTQAVGKLSIDVEEYNIDFASLSAHKIYGPKGIGAAYVGSNKYGIRHKIEPLIHGGKQEFSLRAGTSSNHDIIGFGEAARLALSEFDSRNNHINIVSKYFISRLEELKVDFTVNAFDHHRIPGIINLKFNEIINVSFFMENKESLCLSAGSACSLNEPSYVINSLGIGDISDHVIRFSFGKDTSINEVDELCELLVEYVEESRI